MNLEFIEEGAPVCPLVRIFGTDKAELALFFEACHRLASAQGEECRVHELPGFQPVGGCALTMISSAIDVGVRRMGKTPRFEWEFTPKAWSDVVAFVEPFTRAPQHQGYQWIAGKESYFGINMGKISVLLSSYPDGRW